MTEQNVIDRLIEDYGTSHFRDRDFHGYRAAPRDVRMFLSMRVLEGEVTNGGLAQFLWNVFYHWRVITGDCSFAYAAIGAEPQAASMAEVTRLLGVHESVCGEHIQCIIATKDFREFNAWCAVPETTMDLTVESVFYQSEILDRLRQSWLSSHAPGGFPHSQTEGLGMPVCGETPFRGGVGFPRGLRGAIRSSFARRREGKFHAQMQGRIRRISYRWGGRGRVISRQFSSLSRFLSAHDFAAGQI